MDSIHGDYGEVRRLRERLLEVIPKQGIELGPAEIEVIYERLIEASGGECALLINRCHDYSLTYDAQRRVADHRGLLAIAYLVYSDTSAQVAEYTAQLAAYACCPIRVFRQREAAIDWLRTQMSAESGATDM